MPNKYKLRSIICKGCGLEKTGNLPKTRNYCSISCFRKSKRPNRKTGKIVNCLTCKLELYRPIVRLKHKPFCNKSCHDQYQSRFKYNYICLTCDQKFDWSPSRKKQNPKFCSIECRNNNEEWILNFTTKGNLTQLKKFGPNKLEMMGSEILKRMSIDFEEQYLINGKILVDAFIPSMNLIIQWDGEYWHGHPDKLKNGIPDNRQKSRMQYDKSQDLYFQKCGYKLLRVWERDIKEEYLTKNGNLRTRIQQIAETSS